MGCHSKGSKNLISRWDLHFSWKKYDGQSLSNRNQKSDKFAKGQGYCYKSMKISSRWMVDCNGGKENKESSRIWGEKEEVWWGDWNVYQKIRRT